ncbi:TauD/TfdA family dioxygenase [Vibrio aquimaris]|uniref:Enduracididine beta-hydroxylase n=1 Tax=Vibrio aquimaris TaxID=2587862 RepID=A0A5P9CM52_9VIBR|nr:TauD/TfdA family dioxygenase [Vibrio aquimaris]QFT27314.1 Enduracididine beta-hydroxylase [Vibrio aquimaris]
MENYKKYCLTTEDLQLINHACKQLMAKHDSVETDSFARDCAVYAMELSRSLREAVLDFKNTAHSYASFLIEGLPIDIENIQTPRTWDCDWHHSETFSYEVIHSLVSCLFGEIFGWSTQENGRFMRHVVPIKADAYEQLGSSSTAELDWHTEEAFHPTPADYVSLMCYRNTEQAATSLCHVDKIVSQLDEETIDILFSNLFCIAPDTSHHVKENNSDHWDIDIHKYHLSDEAKYVDTPISILYGNRKRPFMRADLPYMAVLGENKGAAKALEKFKLIVNQSLIDVCLIEGQIMLIDNRRAVHGRRQFSAKYDHYDRWLKRINIIRDLRSLTSEFNQLCDRRII